MRNKCAAGKEIDVSQNKRFELRHIIGGKHKLRILWDLKHGALRFGAIRKKLNLEALDAKQVAPRVLSRELKSLSELGLVHRRAYNEIPPRVEYSLTRLGQSWLPVISKMLALGARSRTRVGLSNVTRPIEELRYE